MDNELKQCTKCKEYKERDLFHNNKSTKDGKQVYCKSCDASYTRAWQKANPEKVNTTSRAWAKANPEKVAEKNRSHKYKLTNDKYQALLESQNNRCHICLKPFTDTPHIDHCHSCCSGVRSCGLCVRGLLCQQCNHMLGRAHDSTEILQAAINYLDKWNQIQYTNKSNSESEDLCNSQN
jgi:hypothetical protein